MLVLRLGRRRTAWESGAIDTIIKTEFSFGGEVELDLSVYLVDKLDVPRAVAEHSAGLGLDPPRGNRNVDLASDRPLAKTPGATGFVFTTEAHRDLRFESEAELREFLVQVILPEIERRTYVATKAEVRSYVIQRRDAGDPEWSSFLAENPRWP